MKIVVSCDGDGHFNVSNLINRQKVLSDIKSICDGDHFINTYDINIHSKIDDESISIDEFESLIMDFTQRGYCEILNIQL